MRTRPIALPALPATTPPGDAAIREALYTAQADLVAAELERDRLLAVLAVRQGQCIKHMAQLTTTREELAAALAQPRTPVVAEEVDPANWRYRALRAEAACAKYDERLANCRCGGGS